MTDTRFIDSTTLGVILGASKRLRPRGGELVLVIDHASIRKIFEITLLDRALSDLRDTCRGAGRGLSQSLLANVSRVPRPSGPGWSSSSSTSERMIARPIPPSRSPRFAGRSSLGPTPESSIVILTSPSSTS